MKTYLFIAIGGLLLSCATTNEPVSERTGHSKERPQIIDTPPESVKNRSENITIKAEIGTFENGDPIQINNAYCEGNTLFLDVSYGGGCGDHSFQLKGSAITKASLPPQRMIQLIHKNHEDYCKAIVTNTIEVNLTELSDSKNKGDKTILLLDGWGKVIEYTFK
ncbi:MAG: hypothetical protein P8N52_00130 [Crocinitomicaceae bacterium]|nr:hypothetical protein [Crocinitomicaceae bacterium]MDG1777608.1 hypothetical protein [Crocinitomicaceae bacterium]